MGTRLEKNSDAVRKRIAQHSFTNEGGEEYSASEFGGFRDYLRRKKIKLQNLDAQIRADSTEPQIFRNIVIYVNGYTQPSLSDLHTAIVIHGGGFQQYLDGKTMVTHVVAGGLTPKKKIEFARYRCVLPQWIVDSIAAKRLLPWEEYRVMDEGQNQKLLSFSEKGLVSQKNSRQDGYKKQTDASWYTEQVKDWADELNRNNSLSQEGKEGAAKVDLRFSENLEDADVTSSTASQDQVDACAPTSLTSDAIGPSSQASRSNRTNADIIGDIKEVNTSAVDSLGDSFGPYRDAQPQSSASTDGHRNTETASSASIQPRSKSNVQPEVERSLQSAGLTDAAADSTSGPGETLQSWTPTAAQPGREATPASDEQPIVPVGAQPEVEHEEQVQSARIQETTNKQLAPKDVKRALTAEEHNTVLLSDPHMAKSSTANPDFINQYYRESRLHHLSTWKAELKARLQARAQASSSQQVKPKRPAGSRRYIMHVDFDSFFAAVSLRKHPQWKSRPVVIAHGAGPGSEIASCNYPARSFGVKNGMWMKVALELCSDLKVLPYDYAAYEEASKHFYDAILAIEGIVQSISIDEALIDVSELCITAGGSDGKGMSEGSVYREQAKANEIATALRASICETTGCEVSVGIGNNILLAKVALRKAKPAGQHLIKPEEVLDFIGELTVTDLPGVAYSMANKLEELGVKYVKDVRALTKERLMQFMGPKTGEKLWDYSRGFDKQEVGDQVVRKSVSTEVNWGIRFRNQEEAETFMTSLCEELSRRLIEQCVKGKQVTMKIMRKAADAGMDPPKNLGHGKCDTFNKSVALGVATNDKHILAKETIAILRGYGFPPGELRGLGVQVQKLEPVKLPVAGSESAIESSQRRLQFKKSLFESTRAAKDSPIFSANRSGSPRIDRTPTKPTMSRVETIEEVPSDEEVPAAKPMRRSKSSPKRADLKAAAASTQFVLPTQVDPAVLAELPEEVRAMLAPKQPKVVEQIKKTEAANIDARSRSTSPAISNVEVLMPNQSQHDPEVFAELPGHLRKGLLAQYNRPNPERRMQRVLPQSPRKTKTLPRKVDVTPKKRQTRTHKSKADTSGMLQTEFMKPVDGANDLIADEEIDEETLNELPEEIRKEILADRRRKAMQKASIGIRHKPGAKFKRIPYVSTGPRIIHFEPRSKPTFTRRKLSTLAELRQSMSDWVQFSMEADEGPDSEDITALADYLYMVVAEELDITKAQTVVEWLEYTVNDQLPSTQQHIAGWKEAIATLKAGMQNAMASRGLKPLIFLK